jgi:hypothetical protein
LSVPATSRLASVRDACLHHRHDIAIALTLATLFALAATQGAARMPLSLMHPDYDDVWFTSDPDRVYANMTYRGSDNSRAVVHPLFLLMTYPPVVVAKALAGVDAAAAVTGVVALVAASWGVLLFLFLRGIGCGRFDAAIVCLLALSSAASMFWFPVPETFGLGSVTILCALVFVVMDRRLRIHPAGYVAMNVLTLGVTSSNVMVGAAATAATHRVGHAMRIGFAALTMAMALWGAQKLVSPSSGFFFNVTELGGESRFVLQPQSGGPGQVARSMFLHTMVMPAIRVVQEPVGKDWPIMLTQRSAAGSASVWGRSGVVLWTVLLVMGFWALLAGGGQRPLRFALGLALAGQLVLHIVYGKETFLYSMHFLALLVPLVGLAFRSAARPVARVLVCLLLVCTVINNAREFSHAVALFEVTGKAHRQSHAQAVRQ